MEALDLSLGPPRPPRDQLAGIVFLPRSIDKVRATLPGGKLGPYQIAGFTQMMLDMLGISLDSFTFAVAKAAGDEDIASFIRTNTMAQERTKWNVFIEAREPRGGNRAEAIVVYPWLAARPDLILALDVLDEDDRQRSADTGKAKRRCRADSFRPAAEVSRGCADGHSV